MSPGNIRCAVREINDKLYRLYTSMNQSSSQPEVSQVIEVVASDRWQVYQRLQELGIPCSYKTGQPLMAQIDHVAAAIQLWSVARPFLLTRCELSLWLERCWQKSNSVR